MENVISLGRALFSAGRCIARAQMSVKGLLLKHHHSKYIPLLKLRLSKFSALYCVVFIILIPSTAFSANITQEEVRAVLTFKLITKIKWPNKDNQSTLQFTYIGNPNYQLQVFEEVASLMAEKGQRFQLSHQTQIPSDFSKIDILYIPSALKNQLPSIAERARRTNTLLMSEDSDAQREFMINLYQHKDGRFKFELNRTNIIFERLTIDRDILLLGGTELDIAELFRESELELQTIKNQLSERRLDLEKLQTKLEKTTRQLANKEREFANKQKDFEKKEAELKQLLKSLEGTEHQLEVKQHDIEEKQRELIISEELLSNQTEVLESKEKSIANQAIQIQNNQSIISQQEKILSENKLNLSTKEGVIQQQRLLLSILAILLLLFILLCFIIFRVSNANKRANAELLMLHEQLALAKDRAESANNAKSFFLANMSHELRTPLNAIVGFSQIILNTTLPKKTRESIEIINSSGNSLLVLINDILQISKIEAGKTDIAEEAVHLDSIIKHIANMLKPKAIESNNNIHVELDGVEDPVFVDAQKLHQILLNLTSNAIKFTRDGNVTIKAVGKQVSNKVYVQFSVIDDGIGIAKEDQTTVFEPFSQVENEFSAEGTGLGLNISRQFVALMGGQLTIDSTTEKGSCFSFTLRLDYADEKDIKAFKALSKVTGITQTSARLTVLIVDDDKTSRILTKNILEPFGFTLFEAGDGAAALELIKSNNIDLLLTDWSIPRLSGIELVKAIRHNDALLQPKIIMISAHAFASDRDAAFEAGVDDFTLKPININALYNQIEQHTLVEFTREHNDAPITSSKPVSEYELQQISSTDRTALEEAIKQLNPIKISEAIKSIESSQPQLAEKLYQYHNAKQYRDLWKLFKLNESNQ